MANLRRRTLRTYKRDRQPLSIWKQYLIGFFVLFSVLTFSTIYVLESASKPFVNAKDQAIRVAKKYAHVTDVSQVTIYNGKESYFAVKAKDATGQAVFVLVPEKSSEIYVYQVDEGISKIAAEQRATDNGAGQIDRSVFGFHEGHAIWEVKSGRAYYLIDFKTGELLKKEGI